VQNCGEGRYGNQETHECVYVNATYNGCQSGHVGNDAGNISTYDTLYRGGECVPEATCRMSGYQVDTVTHKCQCKYGHAMLYLGNIEHNGTHYNQGECIPERVCKESELYVDTARHMCVYWCEGSRYVNLASRECVTVSSKQNGCGEGYVGNSAGGFKFSDEYYDGGSCVTEAVCKGAGYYVDAARH